MVLTERSVVRVMTPISVSSRNITKCSHFSNAGFTLLEIILVLAIIGLASVLIFPNVGNFESRTTFIIESNGRIFVTCDYMGTALGRFWKKWAVQATEGDGAAELRIGNVRYERTLKRVTEGPEIDWVIQSKTSKYRSLINREMIAEGETWVFEIAPRV